MIKLTIEKDDSGKLNDLEVPLIGSVDIPAAASRIKVVD